MNRAIPGGGPKGCDPTHVIVIRDCQYFDAEFDSLIDNGLCVANRVTVRGLPPEGTAVVVRVHLKRTPVESCSRRCASI